jgi:hypothetical protein
MEEKKCFTFAGGSTMVPDFLKQSFDEELFNPCTSLVISERSLLNINSNCKEFE